MPNGGLLGVVGASGLVVTCVSSGLWAFGFVELLYLEVLVFIATGVF